MKQRITLTVILLISVTLSAQEAGSALNVAKQSLDSIVSSRSKTAYTYDANGYTTLELTLYMDTIRAEWVGVGKIEKVNDAKGYGISYARYYWDEVLNQWAGANRFDWTRDENGEVLMYTLSTVWDAGTGQYIPGIKYENVRDQNGNRTSYTKFQWDTDSSKYLLSESGDLTYDEDGNRTSYTRYDWDADSNRLILAYRDDMGYDDNGNNTSFISQSWDQDSSKWIANYKLDYTFDAENNKTLTLRYDWDGSTGLWIPVSKQDYVFNENSSVLLQSESVWIADSGVWVMQSKLEREYDADGFNTYSASYDWDDMLDRMVASKRWESIPDSFGNTQSSIISVWDNDMSGWIERDKTEYSFDYAYTRQDLMTKLSAKHKITRRIEYYFEKDELKSGDWKVIEDFIYHYSDLVVNVTDLSDFELSIYPNPASEYIQVEGDLDTESARIVMYNVSGKVVMNLVLDNGGRIRVGHLSQGIYVIRLVHGSKVKTGKVMIE